MSHPLSVASGGNPRWQVEKGCITKPKPKNSKKHRNPVDTVATFNQHESSRSRSRSHSHSQTAVQLFKDPGDSDSPELKLSRK